MVATSAKTHREAVEQLTLLWTPVGHVRDQKLDDVQRCKPHGIG
jgi:hypothetical protein